MKFWLVRVVSVVLLVAGCFALDAFAKRGPNPELLIRMVMLAGLYVTLSVSLNLINGITGQFSIGHAAFYMVGAYTAGYVSNHYATAMGLKGASLMFVLMVLGAMGAALAGFIVGLPSLRLRGDYLAVVTLGFGEIIRIVTQATPALGGSAGMNIDIKGQFIWMVWLLAILCIAVCRNLLKTAHGLAFLAVREDEIASSAMGVNVTKIKVTAFVIGSAFAGAAGALLASYDVFISPTSFSMELSFTILTMVVLGGTGSITGAALAGAVLFYLPERLKDMQAVTGASLLAAVIAVLVAVWFVKRISDYYHGPKRTRAGLYFAAIGGGLVLKFLLGLGFGMVPVLAQASFESNRLRMVIFAGMLIILMLIRPQGVFAHHEFSWSWLSKLLGRKEPGKAVAA